MASPQEAKECNENNEKSILERKKTALSKPAGASVKFSGRQIDGGAAEANDRKDSPMAQSSETHIIENDEESASPVPKDDVSEETKQDNCKDTPSGKPYAFGGLQERWDEMFNQLVEFKREYGHCLVPNRYPENAPLGAWVSTQRRQYKLFNSGSSESTTMSRERAERLESIGFAWETKDPRHVPWETRFQELCQYKKKFGDCLVPIGYKDNVQLSNWVSTQRQERKLLKEGRSSRLTQERVNALERIGFVWEAQRGGRRKKTKRQFQDLKEEVVTPESTVLDDQSQRIQAGTSILVENPPTSGSSLGFVPPPVPAIQPGLGDFAQIQGLNALSAASSGSAAGLMLPSGATSAEQMLMLQELQRGRGLGQNPFGQWPLMAPTPSMAGLGAASWYSSEAMLLSQQHLLMPNSGVFPVQMPFGQIGNGFGAGMAANGQPSSLASIPPISGSLTQHDTTEVPLEGGGKKPRLNLPESTAGAARRLDASFASSKRDSIDVQNGLRDRQRSARDNFDTFPNRSRDLLGAASQASRSTVVPGRKSASVARTRFGTVVESEEDAGIFSDAEE